MAWSKQATILGPPSPAPSGTGLVKTAAGILVDPATLLVNADVDAGAAIAESKLALDSDAAAGTASRRTLGTGAAAACAGNDARLSDARQLAAGADKTKLDALVAGPYAIVVASGATSAPHNTWTTVSFGTTPALLTDPSGFYSASYPTRLTVPAGMGGLYQVVGGLRFAANTVGRRMAQILLNGATTESLMSLPAASVAGQTMSLNLPVLLVLVAGDYLELQGFQDSGAALDMVQTTPTAPRLSLCRLIKTT